MKSMVTDPQGHRKVHSLFRRVATLGATLSLSVAGLAFVASSSASAAPKSLVSNATLISGTGSDIATTSARPYDAVLSLTTVANPGAGDLRPLVAPVNQAALRLTSISGTSGTPLTLTSSGGSGTGAVTYDVTSFGTAGCGITSGKLNAAREGTCTVTATKAADTTYLVAHSAATTVTFAHAALKTQSVLKLTSTVGTAGTPLIPTSSGGSGTGVVTYAVTSAGTAGCAITAAKLIAIRQGTCTVTVTKAADTSYLVAHSAATTVTFAHAALKTQATLTLTSTTETLGTALTLTSSGGSGTGAVTYDVTSFGTAGCGITSGKLNAARAGTCTVTVTKAADTDYLIARSLATTVTFKSNIVPVNLTARSVSGFVQVGRTVLVTINGTGFFSKPTIRSNEAGTSAVVIHDYRTALVVRVRLLPGSARGWHVFTVILANGHSCKVRYLVK